jgi:hypothetical protein
MPWKLPSDHFPTFTDFDETIPQITDRVDTSLCSLQSCPHGFLISLTSFLKCFEGKTELQRKHFSMNFRCETHDDKKEIGSSRHFNTRPKHCVRSFAKVQLSL